MLGRSIAGVKMPLFVFFGRAGVLAAVLTFCCIASAAPQVSARAATLEAIRMLENPRGLETPGPGGELGAYQFREATWRQYTHAPFAQANDRQLSDRVAEQHYDWLKSRLEAHGMKATPYTIALAWNAGISAVVRGRMSPAAIDYATRASALAAEFEGVATSR